jgi:DNA-binding LacI/PurR family transcriptional regulator
VRWTNRLVEIPLKQKKPARWRKKRRMIEKKIKIPQQVGIVGYDDIALSAYVTPGLTTINQNQYDLGTEAMVMLDELIKGGKVKKKKVIPSELVLRDSTTKI